MYLFIAYVSIVSIIYESLPNKANKCFIVMRFLIKCYLNFKLDCNPKTTFTSKETNS